MQSKKKIEILKKNKQVTYPPFERRYTASKPQSKNKREHTIDHQMMTVVTI